jgi:hypothetical protein
LVNLVRAISTPGKVERGRQWPNSLKFGKRR